MLKEGREKREKIILIMVSLLAVFAIVKVLFHSIHYELGHTYTADAPLYWAVGRGILNGIKPYTGLYEVKPVGVFLISALSFKLTNDTIICNVFSVAALIVIGILPMIYAVEFSCKHKEKGVFHSVAVIVFTALSGILLMLYCEIRSGQFQVESMGAAWIGLYYWVILHISCKCISDFKKPSQIIWLLLAALFVMCGVMMKEPFVLLAFFGGLLLVENWKEFVGRIVIPLGLGGMVGFGIMIAEGWLNGYLNVYVRNMFQNHISVTGSPIIRGFRILWLAKDMRNVSDLFLALIILLIIINILPNKECSKKRNMYHIVRMLVLIYIASFAVGLGGQYFNHHYIFAAPFYLLILFIGSRKLYDYSGEYLARQTVAVILSILVVCVGAASNLPFAGEYEGKYKVIKEHAAYVDSLLDYYGEDTYQYLGFNGENVFFGLTKHSPLGPCFAQYEYDFETEDSWFSKKLLEEMNSANIVIFSYLNVPAINAQVKQILDTDFTTTPANSYTEKPVASDFKYTVYFRKSVYGQ